MHERHMQDDLYTRELDLQLQRPLCLQQNLQHRCRWDTTDLRGGATAVALPNQRVWHTAAVTGIVPLPDR
jgi:hypothetical protein